MRKFVMIGLVLNALFFLSGCTSSLMQKSDIAATTIPPVDPGLAQVVFMRPSSFGGAIQSSVFDLKHNENGLQEDRFVGIVSASTKVAYQTAPGFHLFMVIGENADFMRANLDAGKTYFALVMPRFGWWKARFSLKPLHAKDLHSDDFDDWLESTDWYQNTADSREWAKDNWSSIQDKKTDYLKKWNQKPGSEKSELTLKASDVR